MSGLNVIPLAVGGDPVIDATVDTVTDAQLIQRSYEWSLRHELTGTTTNPKVEFQGSDDQATWHNVMEDAEGAPLQMELSADNNPAQANTFPYKYFRVKTFADGNGTGTVKHFLTIVQDS